MLIENGHVVTQTIRWLSQGPRPYIFQHPGYDINGFHFVTRDRDLNRVTQNSGVSLVAQIILVFLEYLRLCEVTLTYYVVIVSSLMK